MDQEEDEVGWASDAVERWTVRDNLDRANSLPKGDRRRVRTQTRRRRGREGRLEKDITPQWGQRP